MPLCHLPRPLSESSLWLPWASAAPPPPPTRTAAALTSGTAQRETPDPLCPQPCAGSASLSLAPWSSAPPESQSLTSQRASLGDFLNPFLFNGAFLMLLLDSHLRACKRLFTRSSDRSRAQHPLLIGRTLQNVESMMSSFHGDAAFQRGSSGKGNAYLKAHHAPSGNLGVWQVVAANQPEALLFFLPCSV